MIMLSGLVRVWCQFDLNGDIMCHLFLFLWVCAILDVVLLCFYGCLVLLLYFWVFVLGTGLPFLWAVGHIGIIAEVDIRHDDYQVMGSSIALQGSTPSPDGMVI